VVELLRVAESDLRIASSKFSGKEGWLFMMAVGECHMEK
jgi:hypothetical protein